MITSFSGKYKFLSNFYACRLVYEDILYPSVEHAYQASKVLDHDMKVRIARLPTAREVEYAGRKLVVSQDWDTRKLNIMQTLLRDKFSTDILQKLLITTGNTILINGNSWDDTFWGMIWSQGAWIGENHLGKLLMTIRQELTHG